ncbi:MAG: hypothetical protein N3A61_05715 [Ignavibacteria bacterium]|nr:hypothetical protein [Ignavibacteria bacterium]
MDLIAPAYIGVSSVLIISNAFAISVAVNFSVIKTFDNKNLVSAPMRNGNFSITTSIASFMASGEIISSISSASEREIILPEAPNGEYNPEIITLVSRKILNFF